MNRKLKLFKLFGINKLKIPKLRKKELFKFGKKFLKISD